MRTSTTPRGYLWTHLREEIVDELSSFRFAKQQKGYQVLPATGEWGVRDPAEAVIDPWDWRRRRSAALKTGVLPERRRRRGRPSSVEAAKLQLKKIREERERKKTVKEKIVATSLIVSEAADGKWLVNITTNRESFQVELTRDLWRQLGDSAKWWAAHQGGR